MDAMEDIHLLPGTGSKEQVPLLDGYITLLTGACHTLLLHVITTPPDLMDLAEPLNQPQNAKIPVLLDTTELIHLTNGL
jgi:hypothetical protein